MSLSPHLLLLIRPGFSIQNFMLVKSKVEKAAFEYLLKQKEKQSKGKLLKYDRLKMQEYLTPGVCNIKVA